MIQKIREALRGNSEAGMTLVEVLVAVTVILTVAVTASLALGKTFQAQSTTEARNRAVGLSQDRLAKGQLIHFADLMFDKKYATANQLEGGLGGLSEYNNEPILFSSISGVSNLPLIPYEEATVGQNDFRVYTYITKVPENNFDGAPGSFSSREDISPRRITVVVEWDSSAGTQSVVRSVVRYPAPSECAPLSALVKADSPNIPEGCKV